MEQKQFQAESKRMLDLMIHSIYTHKEIFLRELISNASDAIDKLYFRSLTDENVGIGKDDFYIELIPDKEKRTLTITDNGIGMTAEELEQNLGVIAHSGSRAFKTENTLDENTDIIGQFDHRTCFLRNPAAFLHKLRLRHLFLRTAGTVMHAQLCTDHHQ